SRITASTCVCRRVSSASRLTGRGRHDARRPVVRLIWASAAMLLALAMTATMRAPDDRSGASAVRLPQNPLITVKTSPSLGDNVNGPAIVRMPAWVKNPLGRYYAYFAHHKGRLIRLAFADAIAGPWKVYEPGVLRVEDTAFMRPPPDP